MSAWFARKSMEMVTPQAALPGREEPIRISGRHFVDGSSMLPPYAEGTQSVVFGMGCFWGAERVFWRTPGVVTTAVGYAGGFTPNPSYEETCSGLTGHTEAVLVVFDSAAISFEEILRAFWEGHDPTQGNRQGNDFGAEYRSAIYWTDESQGRSAEVSRDRYEEQLVANGYAVITTEIKQLTDFYFAEEYHQQYLAKVPNGYCGIGGTGVACPVGLTTA